MLDRNGSANTLYVMAGGSILVLAVLCFLLLKKPGDRRPPDTVTGGATAEGDTEGLFMYCAAGMQYAMEKIVADYKKEYDVSVQLQYAGSNTLLNQLDVSKTGDLFLAADDSYIKLAAEKDLIAEVMPIALMKPVIAVANGNPKNIRSVADLTREDVKVGLGDPGAAAVGKKTRRLLTASGHWADLENHVTATGVFKPTVNDVAIAVQIGSVDAGIIWDTTAAQYTEITSVSVPELDAGLATVSIAIVTNSKYPTAALRFARYVTARDKGLKEFRASGFNALDGDAWEEKPEITFFSGAVNRGALEPIIAEFEQREGITVNAVYNGCGILTATMRGIQKGQAGAFPDAYMACDVYYLQTVDDLFQNGVNVSDTDIVMVTQKGNPKGIRELNDLLEPGVRVVLGEADKCTIGVLSRRLLQSEGLYDKLKGSGNLVNQTTSSALLVPQVATGSADVVLAYRTDTLAEASRFDVIGIESPLAKAVQPFSVARSSDFKRMGLRLFDKISQSRAKFESKGFHWRLGNRSTTTAASTN